MAANDPRIEIRLPPEKKRRLQELRRQLSKKAGRHVSMSETVESIIDQFFELTDRGMG